MCAASISSSQRFSGCIFEGCFFPDLMLPGAGLKFCLDPFRVLNALIDKSSICCSNRFLITFLVVSSCFDIVQQDYLMSLHESLYSHSQRLLPGGQDSRVITATSFSAVKHLQHHCIMLYFYCQHNTTYALHIGLPVHDCKRVNRYFFTTFNAACMHSLHPDLLSHNKYGFRQRIPNMRSIRIIQFHLSGSRTQFSLSLLSCH